MLAIGNNQMKTVLLNKGLTGLHRRVSLGMHGGGENSSRPDEQ